MSVPIFQVDAFASALFGGNPAAVMVMPGLNDAALLQAIAAENNLAETAFITSDGAGDYRIRWFTPIVEVPLCGHATLASAAVVMERLEPGRARVTFQSASGPLPVMRDGDVYALDFPARPSEEAAAPAGLALALGTAPVDVQANAFNYMVVLADAQAVREIRPDLRAIAALDRPGLIVTARGDQHYDCVSRYFAPAKGIDEDPVTGGAHCMITPYWARRLGRTDLQAFQASPRGGEIDCRLRGDRVELRGGCVFYMTGEVWL